MLEPVVVLDLGLLEAALDAGVERVRALVETSEPNRSSDSV